jgi:uncharacterized protein (TIGR02996 family)
VTEAEHLEAIAGAPDDDDPRLVYADWLLERGDPRGELIQLQCRRRRQSPSPTAVGRERELLDRHEWLGPLRPFVRSSRFLRGFLDDAELRGGSDLLPLVRHPVLALVRRLVLEGVDAVVQRELVVTLRQLRSVARIDAWILFELARRDEPLALEKVTNVRAYGLGELRTLATGTGLARLRHLELSTSQLAPVYFEPFVTTTRHEHVRVELAGWTILLERRPGEPARISAEETRRFSRPAGLSELRDLIYRFPRGDVSELVLTREEDQARFSPQELDALRMGSSDSDLIVRAAD